LAKFDVPRMIQPPSRCDTHRKKSYAMWLGSIWQYLAVFGRIVTQRVYTHLWQYLAVFGSIWQNSHATSIYSSLAVFGSIWQYLAE
jgi:hypothetical protein